MRKNWKTTVTGIVGVIIGLLQLLKCGNVDETTIGFIVAGLGQILSRDYDAQEPPNTPTP